MLAHTNKAAIAARNRAALEADVERFVREGGRPQQVPQAATGLDRNGHLKSGRRVVTLLPGTLALNEGRA